MACWSGRIIIAASSLNSEEPDDPDFRRTCRRTDGAGCHLLRPRHHGRRLLWLPPPAAAADDAAWRAELWPGLRLFRWRRLKFDPARTRRRSGRSAGRQHLYLDIGAQALPDPGQRRGVTLRHRRRPRRLPLDRHPPYFREEGMAELDPASGDARPAAGSAALHGRRDRKPPWRACDV